MIFLITNLVEGFAERSARQLAFPEMAMQGGG
jgi:hypothetical protein